MQPNNGHLKNKRREKVIVLRPRTGQSFRRTKTEILFGSYFGHFYPDRKRIIETDASDFALGCILSQYIGKRLHPVAFHI